MKRTFLLVGATALAFAAANATASQARRPVIIQTALGGQVLGYDIDQNGSEGVLSEWLETKTAMIIAIETFEQKTGKVKLIKKIQQPSYAGDLITLGVVGTSVGLVERQWSNPYIYKTTYDLLDPLDSNKISGHWTPGLRRVDNHIQEVSESQGSATTAVLGMNFKTFESFVFGANVATNISGPIVRLTDSVFNNANYPVMALDTATNQAVVAATNSGFFETPELAVADLTKGGFSEFAGLGNGEVNGIAVDSSDDIAVTSTQNDWNIEFYDLENQSGSIQTLQGATSNINSGADVQFDPVNKLFLIDQQVCAGSESGTCIQVYDTKGNWVETTNVINGGFGHIAFNPNTRTGFLWLNDSSKFDELESFTY